MTYQALLAEISVRAGFDPPDRAQLLTQTVLATLGRRLSSQCREQVGHMLPTSLAAVVAFAEPAERNDPIELVRDVAAGSLSTDAERARCCVQAVLSTLTDLEPDAAHAIRADLPPSYGELFAAPGGDRPRLAGTGLGTAPVDLTSTQISEALVRLPGWQGDSRALWCAVALPPELDRAILDRIHAAEAALQHRAVVQRSDDDTIFTVWTRSTGAVTDLDVELARRIAWAIEEC
ncbi:MAG: hypothetical protein JWO57_2792 [Pseudonocardiales bacterium]|nr:hypothetical protein [Pseudonocardiales bacterium]